MFRGIGMKIKYLAAAFAIAFLSMSQPVSAAEENYIIGEDDLLEISVWQSPELSKTVTVDSDGKIQYAVLGSLDAAGLSLVELSKDVSAKLADGYVKDPKVTVAVKEYNSKKILVFGEVEKPGLYKIKHDMPLLEMLFIVGGVKPDAKRMTVIRPQGDQPNRVPAGLKASDLSEAMDNDANTVQEVDLISLLSKGDLSQNIIIKPGDTIYVASGTGQKFYVLGQVNNPGPIEWTGEITVLEAIKLADGPTDLAALNRIMIRKGMGDKQKKVKVNVLNIMKGKSKDDTFVEPGNVVIVPRSWV